MRRLGLTLPLALANGLQLLKLLSALAELWAKAQDLVDDEPTVS